MISVRCTYVVTTRNREGYVVEHGEFKVKGYDGPLVECDKCGSDMVLKNGRFGKYMDCTSEDCKNTRKILKMAK